MEDLPYLEILCASDGTGNTQGLASEVAREEEEGSATETPQGYEKQGSLITLAWSKPPEDHSDHEAEAAVGGPGQGQDDEGSLKTQVQPRDIRSTAEHTQCEDISGERHREDLKHTRLQSDSGGHLDAQSADPRSSTVGQVLCKCKADHKTLLFCIASYFTILYLH